MTKTFLYLILLCLGTTAASEIEYIIRPSQAQNCGDQCSDAETVDNSLTLSQFVNNSIDYLTNDTTLIFSLGNYSLESELIVENVHSFSMFEWPSFSPKAIIVCGRNGRFEFRNVSIVIVSGLEFVGCLQNHVISVGQFQLENSRFSDSGQAIVSGTVLTIVESAANLDRVAFIAAVEKLQSSTTQELPENYTDNIIICKNTIASMDNMVIGILLRGSSIRITQGWFKGNKVGHGGVIYGEFGSDITIFNTTFVNNKAASYQYCNDSYCFIYYGGIVSVNIEPQFINNSAPFATVYARVADNNLVISHSTFTNNTGRVLDARYTGIVYITHSEFVNNIELTGSLVYIDGVLITVSQSEFINNRAGYIVIEIQYTRIGQMMLQAGNTSLSVSYSKFVGNNGHIMMYVHNRKFTIIDHTKLINNTGSNSMVLQAENTKSVSIRHSEVIGNNGYIITIFVDDGFKTIVNIDHSKFANNTGSWVIRAENANVSISHSEFVFNSELITFNGTIITTIDHSKFINNTGQIVRSENTRIVSITHSEFVDNTATGVLVYLDGDTIIVKFNEFINNAPGRALLYIHYYITAENLINNVFIDNSASYEAYVSSVCRPGSGLSLGNPRCIPCTDNWHRNLIGIVIAAFIAGIALVIFMLALNMTVAVGTLNGILFYAHIVAANADTYFWPFTTPTFVTMFISWLNLDIGFDACFSVGNSYIVGNETRFIVDPSLIYKALMQLTFPAYVIFLVIIVIIASECSSKFAKIIGKGNPIAVLATLILLSYAKFYNAILASMSLLYLQPAYGSRHVDVAKLASILMAVGTTNGITHIKAISYILILVSILILFLGVIYTALVFSWQWLLRYQDKIIFKWVRYQKLRHFLDPYHAPYTAKYRYWTGLLLFVRAFLYLISILNFSLDPRVDLVTTILIVGSLILLKGVTAKRIYKNWLLDVMETAIYFNLVAFSAFTWYNLDFGGNQVAVAYTSVTIMFILLLGVIVFHIFRYTRLYKYSFVEKAFKWITTKLIEKKQTQESPNDALEELDGYQLERTAAGDQGLPTITYSVIEIRQSTQNQEETF